MNRKITAIITLVIMAVLIVSNVALAFNDTTGHWAEEYANRLNEKGILSGDENGNANLSSDIRRSEFITMLVRSIYGTDVKPQGSGFFFDVPSKSWFYNTVTFAYEKGLVKGDGSGYFSPDSVVKREEIVLMIARALNLTKGDSNFIDIPKDYIYYNEISAVAETNIINGYTDGTFAPKQSATRGEVAAMLCRMLDYIDKYGLPSPTPTPTPTPTPSHTPVPSGALINLTWHQVYNPDVTKTGNHMDGVSVISPMWFKVLDNTGKTPYSYEHPISGGLNFYIEDLGNSDYIKDVRMEGYQIWPIFRTDFGPSGNSKFLNNADARHSAVEVMKQMIQKYGLDGINLDFENMNVGDKNMYTEFVKEMYTMTQSLGVKLSVDVTKYTAAGGTWSLCYDRKELSKYVDYVALMAYDENGTFSKTAGSVSSLPWVEDAIKITLNEVPANKLLLGVPFYTRLWEEVDGVVTKSSAIGMATAQQKIADAGAAIVYDQNTGQNYAEWKVDNTTYKIWLEDKTSLKERIDLIHKYNLAGIASWSKTFETSDTWDFIDQNLQKK